MILKWHRDGRGRQVSECGRYAVEFDGFPRGELRDERDGGSYGYGGECAAILVASDENLNWFATMREAKVACQEHANR